MKRKFLVLLLTVIFITGCSKKEETPTNESEYPTSKPLTLKEQIFENKYIEFELLDKKYQLPVAYETLANDGWTSQIDLSQELEPNTFVSNISLHKDDYIIKVSFYNNTGQTIPMDQALIARIEAESHLTLADITIDMVVPLDITFDDKYETVVETYGEPTSVEENAVFQIVEYRLSNTASISFKFNLDDEEKYNKTKGDMRWMIIENFRDN